MSRPPSPAPADLLTVFVGGAVGTAARAGIGLLIPPVGRVPVATWGINVLGAFLLGWLLAALTRTGEDRGRRRTIRLLVGTGGLGGFTTYSALTTDAAQLATSGSYGAALASAAGTVVIGAAASVAGIALGARLSRQAPQEHWQAPQ